MEQEIALFLDHHRKLQDKRHPNYHIKVEPSTNFPRISQILPIFLVNWQGFEESFYWWILSTDRLSVNSDKFKSSVKNGKMIMFVSRRGTKRWETSQKLSQEKCRRIEIRFTVVSRTKHLDVSSQNFTLNFGNHL